jgi:hypothetical protein
LYLRRGVQFRDVYKRVSKNACFGTCSTVVNMKDSLHSTQGPTFLSFMANAPFAWSFVQ